MNKQNDTILAQSTPIGMGGIGVIRISGNKVKNISKIILGKITKDRKAEYLPFKNKKKQIIDYGIALLFKKPNSFTGEDVLELHSHGGQKVIEIIINSILSLNYKTVRIAKPGEFTERAFINKKIDLTQAEAINEIIKATSEIEVFSAIKSIEGFFSKKIKKIIKKINNLIIYIEKEISFIEKNNIKKIIIYIKKKIKKIYIKIKIFILEIKNNLTIKDGLRIIILGKPNVGKSSLINLLTKKNISIITDIPGTTRDIIKDYININNINIEILDTAGIHKTKNKIEKIGISKIWSEIKKSNIIIFIDDATKSNIKKIIKNYKNLISNKIETKNKKIILLRNKIDITKEKKKKIKKNNFFIFNVSIKKNIGIDLILLLIKKYIKCINTTENTFYVRQRHLNLIKKTFNIIKKIKNIIKIIYKNNEFININIDLILNELIYSQKILNEIIGINTNNENILSKIFKNFCIGK